MFEEYKDLFVRQYKSPLVINYLNGRWKTRHHNLHDKFIEQHLQQNYWLAVRGSWYPRFYYIDFDFSDRDAHRAGIRIGRVLDLLKLSESQFYLMTSPKFFKNGANCHLIFRLKYKDNFPTLTFGLNFLHQVLQNEISDCDFEKKLEIYPQKNRCFRLPFGRDQYLLSPDGTRILSHLDWKESTYFCEKIDPIEIQDFKVNKSFSFNPPSNRLPQIGFSNTDCEKGRILFGTGLQNGDSRNASQWEVVKYLASERKQSAEKIREEVADWLRENHNGYSFEVNSNNWRKINKEIARQVSRIFTKLPDKPKFLITVSDLQLVARYFFGNTVNQVRFVKFLSYCRPRIRHEWIYLPHSMCCKFAGKNYYKDFLTMLEKLGIIEMKWEYLHKPDDENNSFCRKAKLLIPLSSKEQIVLKKSAPVNLYEAWLKVNDNDVPLSVRQTGIKRQRFYCFKKKHLE